MMVVLFFNPLKKALKGCSNETGDTNAAVVQRFHQRINGLLISVPTGTI
jgi:hypothetical protein